MLCQVPSTSYFLHFDSGGEQGTLRATGSITFNRPVIGIVARVPHLDASDSILGAPGVHYSKHPWRAIDTAMSAETGRLEYIALSEDRQTLTVILSLFRDLDQVRILVEASEETMDEN